MKLDFITEFKNNGYFHQCTNIDALIAMTNKQSIAAYIGFDCTAKSLHVGNLMQIMILRLLQRCGHKPIVIIGGATTKIGDPTDKDEMRKIPNSEDLQTNVAGIKHCLEKFIQFGDGPTDAIIIDNSLWLEKLNYFEFLKDFGRLISVNKMLSQDSVKLRLEREQNLSFLEFNYMLFQAYDFYYLNKNYACALQIGGSDQWGNIISGVELIRKINNSDHSSDEMPQAIGLTTPLLTTANGSKMGKSVSGAVWLHEDMLSPYEYFQYWRNIDDLDVVKFAQMFAEFDNIAKQQFHDLVANNINEAKKSLAYHLTKLCHGSENADQALATAVSLFENGVTTQGLPEYSIDQKLLSAGISISEILSKYELTESKSAARKLVRGGGVRLNDEKLVDENHLITTANLQSNNFFKISIGKKKHILIKLNELIIT